MRFLLRRLTGLVAVLLIVGLLVGVPALLVSVGADPFQLSFPGWSEVAEALTSPDDGSLVLTLLMVAAWVAWAFLAISILIEVASRLRGVRAPRLPGFKLPQKTARGLVSAAMLLFVAAPMAVSAAEAPNQVSVQMSPGLSASQTPGGDVTDEVRALTGTAMESTPETVPYTVKQGDSLWSLAAAHLGDGHRFSEIHDLNRAVLGDNPSFLRAGVALELPAPPAPAPAAEEPDLADATEDGFPSVEVVPGDTLWGISEAHLGEGERYTEIYDLNEGQPQADGSVLTDPNLIHPGWVLTVPSEEAGPAADFSPAIAQTVPDEIEEPSGASSSDGAGGGAAEGGSAEGAGDVGATEPGAADPGVVSGGGDGLPELPVSLTTSVDQAPADVTAEADLEEAGSGWVRTAAGVGAVLAAGVLALVATRRGIQQRHRKPGQRIPMPEEAAAAVEQELRAVADPLSVEAVDAALRSVASHAAERGEPLPSVRAARLTRGQFDLYLSEAALLPDPWISAGGDTVWSLSVDAIPPASEDHDIPAPYPALVTIGHDEEDGHVLLNLEQLGALGVSGTDEEIREVLAALTIELSTSAWADDLQVTVVGAYPELEDRLLTGRIRYLPTIGAILDDLESRAIADRQAMEGAGTPTLHQARASKTSTDSWSPEIIVLAGESTDSQNQRLQQLVTDLPRVAVAAVTSGTTLSDWSLDLTASTGEHALLEPIGLELRPQRIPVDQYHGLLEVAGLASEPPTGDAVPDPTLEEVDAVDPVDDSAGPRDLDLATDAPEAGGLTEDPVVAHTEPEIDDTDVVTAAAATTEPELEEAEEPALAAEEESDHTIEPLRLPPPRILLLGKVEMTNATGPVEPSKRGRLLELAAYLALNPAATHNQIDEAIWPTRTKQDNLNTRNTATSKLRRWVGTTPEGQDYLPRHQAGQGYSLHPDVTTDVDEWRDLLSDDPFQAPTENLEAALALVRGRPFDTTKGRRRYAWAEPLEQDLIAEIVDTAYELGRRRLMEGRWRAAERTVVTALAIEPGQESLWRLRILAAYESHDSAAVSEGIERLMALVEDLESDLEPETQALLEALKQPKPKTASLIANM